MSGLSTVSLRNFSTQVMTYPDNWNNVRITAEELRILPHSELLYPRIGDDSTIFQGIRFQKNFSRYITALSKEDLLTVIIECAKIGFMPLIQSILASKKCAPKNNFERDDFFFTLGEAVAKSKSECQYAVVHLFITRVSGFYDFVTAKHNNSRLSAAQKQSLKMEGCYCYSNEPEFQF